MLNTSLHNKNARLGGTFTYEKFVVSLSETIARHQVPDQTIIKVRLKWLLRLVSPTPVYFLIAFIVEYLR
jgi:hypothetical protein